MSEITFDQVKISRAIAKLVDIMYETQTFVNMYVKEINDMANNAAGEDDSNRTYLSSQIHRDRFIILTCKSILDILSIKEG